MKNSPNPTSVSSEPAHGGSTIAQFWACFFLCLLALGLISGLMLAGFFLLMGYRVF